MSDFNPTKTQPISEEMQAYLLILMRAELRIPYAPDTARDPVELDVDAMFQDGGEL